MSTKIDDVFGQYSKKIPNRKDEIKAFISRYFEGFFETHQLLDMDRIEATDRIKLAGFHPNLAGWHNRGEIVVCSCEERGGSQVRYDYKFIFEWKEPEPTVVEKAEKPKAKIEEKPKEEPKEEEIKESDEEEEEEDEEESEDEVAPKKNWKDFTPEEKEQYRRQKEQEKKEVQESFDTYMKARSVKDVVQLIDRSLALQNYKPVKKIEEVEEGKEGEKITEEIPKTQAPMGYSLRNYLLVLAQARKRQDEKFTGVISSFFGWKKQGATVQKNPDKSKPYSYKILVPLYKKSASGSAEGAEFLKKYKLGSVFDISQTNKYDEFLSKKEEAEKQVATREEINYEQAKSFSESKFSSLKIIEDENSDIVNSKYDSENKSIIIKQKSSHALFQALGYHIISTELNVASTEGEAQAKNEMLAELTCYLLMKKFEETPQFKINYNFGYSNCWALQILDLFKFGEFEQNYNAILEYVKKL